MRFLIVFFIQFFVLFLYGQETFYKLYSGTGFDEGHGIVQLADSSYIITGSSGSFAEHSQAFLLATDKFGDYIWSKSYGGAESDIGKRVLHIPNDGFLIAGFSNSYGQGDFDAFLIKTDLSGNEQWVENYMLPSCWEKINDAVLTADSGVVMVGEALPISNGNSDVYIIRTDKYGDTLWTKHWGSEGEDFATSVEQKNDHFIIAGQWYISDSSLNKGFLMEIDGDGNQIWKDTISDLGGNYVINDISMSSDKIFAVGSNNSSGNSKGYLGVFNLSGNLISQYTTNEVNQNKSRCNQVQYVAEWNKVAIAFQTKNSSTFQDNYDLVYAYFEPINLTWLSESQIVSNEGIDEVGQLFSTSDGGFIGVGFSMSTGFNEFTFNGGSHFHLFKVGFDNSFPITHDVSLLNPIVELKNKEGFHFATYPNPVERILNIQFENTVSFDYKIFDVMGKEVYSGKLSQFNQIDLTDLQKGIYLFVVENFSTRIIKK